MDYNMNVYNKYIDYIFWMKTSHVSKFRDRVSPYVKLGRFGFGLVSGTITKRPNHGKWIRDELVTLGPAYIKLGQIASTRKDLFPSYITSELEGLQDNVTPVGFQEMDDVFDSEFGQSTTTYFKTIVREPVACASIAQVYLATMQNDMQVVVKIQKPGLMESVAKDLAIIDHMLSFLNKIDVKVVSDLSLLVNECSTNLMSELDFRNEMSNLVVFRGVFSSFDNLQIPRVYSKVTKDKVLIMEYLPGTKLNAITSGNPNVSNNLMVAFLKGLLEHGYLHADPHGGNIALSPEGKLILYDFGLVARYDEAMILAFRTLVKCFILRQTNEIIDCLLTNDIIFMYQSKHAKSHTELSPGEYVVLYELIQYLLEYSKNTDISAVVPKLQQDPYVDASDLPFYFNSKMILLFKTFTTLEGVCKQLHPEFSYTSLYINVIQNIIDVDFINSKMMSDMELLMKPMVNDFREQDSYHGIQAAKMSVMSEKFEKHNQWFYVMFVVSMLDLFFF
jgi:predicted unusual protein kinase regulating ubiquinone biosynthesis (AarF/ABC1/UbiB family)